MTLFLAVTDNDWFRFLRRRPALDAVNFLQPGGGRRFRALAQEPPSWSDSGTDRNSM
jgi:hypothetical protein